MTGSGGLQDAPGVRRLDRSPLYEAIVNRLREYAVAAGLQRGDRLPSERDLAEQLGTSRASVKQALVVLEVQGLVETRHGGGTFLLRDELAAESVSTMLDRQARLPYVLEAREAIETHLAALAARRRTDADLAVMDDALAAMQRAVAGIGDPAVGDRHFHEAVAKAAGNALLNRFLAEIDAEIDESRVESLRQRGRPAQSLRQHQAIADAIAIQDPAGARRAMSRHLTSVGKVRLLAWSPALDEEHPASSER
ncbi:MAG TPA: FadR/GntR family transcriptional regulator [Mycobacteriales bacterium]|jgi:GntR family transcriptional repressor for pyruvate dehydrogenase complex|nr:FadR/GntR family transcriptional regulator [Mycobacteriales bacterium]